ncbi:hypothetical protein D9613_002345 [Agrocybe pediades]|uniref:Uncharacterized protein n=1 Tax=Agrocybe pediades TaxID=84607 RepID=A0A8H4R6M5_9AGAR|nr:hypothetical protein D9613_002345 [Agrocybe pediades]
MLNHVTMLRSNLLRLTVVLSFWLRASHMVIAKDLRIEDGDSAIVYLPQSSWHSNLDSCSACLNPGGGASYHEAIHPPFEGNDPDDHSSTTKPPASTKAAPSQTPPPQNIELSGSVGPTPSNSATQPKVTTKPPDGSAEEEEEEKEEKEHQKGKGSEGSEHDPSRRRSFGIFSPRDADDGPDVNVTLSFNFTGSAIHLFAISPLGMATTSIDGTRTPTNTNLTFVLDSIPYPHISPTSQGPLTFEPSSEIFSQTGLENVPHQLVVHVGQNSTFLFDYLVYDDGTTNTSTTGPDNTGSQGPTPQDQTAPSASTDQKTKNHNVATFAGAVGGSVGVLALFSLGLAISIIRRRRLAARRDRLDSESLHTNSSDDSPPMVGPAPFTPRFFPDTVIPQDPPTYTTAVATNHNNNRLLATLASSAYANPPPVTNRSYADIPPSTPPPPLEDMMIVPPPPPFPVAVNAPRTPPSGLPVVSGLIPPPMPIPLPEGAPPPPPLELGDETAPLAPGIVGTPSSASTTPPELVPLLQPVVIDVVDVVGLRPLSRISTRSTQYDINGNPIEDDDEEYIDLRRRMR